MTPKAEKPILAPFGLVTENLKFVAIGVYFIKRKLGQKENENIKVLFLVGRYKFYHLLGNHSLPYYSTTVFI